MPVETWCGAVGSTGTYKLPLFGRSLSTWGRRTPADSSRADIDHFSRKSVCKLVKLSRPWTHRLSIIACSVHFSRCSESVEIIWFILSIVLIKATYQRLGPPTDTSRLLSTDFCVRDVTNQDTTSKVLVSMFLPATWSHDVSLSAETKGGSTASTTFVRASKLSPSIFQSNYRIICSLEFVNLDLTRGSLLGYSVCPTQEDFGNSSVVTRQTLRRNSFSKGSSVRMLYLIVINMAIWLFRTLSNLHMTLTSRTWLQETVDLSLRSRYRHSISLDWVYSAHAWSPYRFGASASGLPLHFASSFSNCITKFVSVYDLGLYWGFAPK